MPGIVHGGGGEFFCGGGYFVYYDAASGRERWTHGYPAKFEERMGGPGPRATPQLATVDGSAGMQLFSLGATGALVCLDAATGKEQWKADVLRGNGNLSWGMAGPMSTMLLADNGVIAEGAKKVDVLLWVMWPATGMLVAGGLTALVLKWKTLVATFRSLSGASVQSGDFPLRWVIGGSLVSSAALVAIQYFVLGTPVWQSVLAIVLSIPLMLVAMRVLGETNWGPISAMSNMMQAIFAFIAPGNVPVNMSSSGLTGTIAVTSEALMQDYKSGQVIGSNPRMLTIAQLIAAPVGSLATAIIYPLLRDKFGIGPEGLSSPISVKWAGFAELLTQGFNALPKGCFVGLMIGMAVGILLTLLAEKLSEKAAEKVPSPSAIGIGMLIPASVLITFVLGGVAQLIWAKLGAKSEEAIRIPLASGLIAGEAILAVVQAILAATGFNF